METSRGRWFLTEYAKRNRNADTRMVLDAVARIEQSLAAQKEESLQKEVNLHREENLLQESLAAHQQQAEEAAAAATAARNNLNDALAAMRGAVEAAQQSAAEALDSLALEQRLAPVRKGARVLREIAWRLREIGNDGRICDLIDSQVAVIESGAEQISSDEARAALRAAFAALEGRLSELGDEGRTPAAETEAAAPSPAPQEMPRAEIVETVAATASVQQAPEAISGSLAAPEEAVLTEAAKAPPVAELTIEAAKSQDAKSQDAKTQDAEAQNAEAHDEALLDMIAMEMGAPDPISDEEIAEAVAEQARLQTSHLAQPAPVELKIAPEPVAVPAPPIRQAVQPSPPRAIEPVPAPAPAPLPAPAAPDGNVARLDHHRERHVAKAGRVGQRSAGADPAHEPGREDRVLLLKRRLGCLKLFFRSLRPTHLLQLRTLLFLVDLTIRQDQAGAIVFRGEGRENQDHRQSDGEQGQLRQALAANSRRT